MVQTVGSASNNDSNARRIKDSIDVDGSEEPKAESLSADE
jgi:hypothetical protein